MNDLQLAYLCYAVGCLLSFFLGVFVSYKCTDDDSSK